MDRDVFLASLDDLRNTVDGNLCDVRKALEKLTSAAKVPFALPDLFAAIAMHALFAKLQPGQVLAITRDPAEAKTLANACYAIAAEMTSAALRNGVNEG